MSGRVNRPLAIDRGPAPLETYRRAFQHHYGDHREVPLVEMVDPHIGIGPMPFGSSDETAVSYCPSDLET
jgi:hypothetical protein